MITENVRFNTATEWSWVRDARVARTVRRYDYPIGNDVAVVEYRAYALYDRQGNIVPPKEELGTKIDITA